MRVTAEPTPELDNIKINGVDVPMRIWRAWTDQGTRLEMCVLSVIPHHDDEEKWKAERPDFMKMARSIMQIADFPDERKS